MTLEKILVLSQKALKKALSTELTSMGYAPTNSKGFLYAEGDVPVLLVAHMDTVHKEQVRTICYSSDRNIIMSPQGIGGDDRAGIYMILKMLKKHRCHVLFCEDEEKGGIGASAFVESAISPQVNYIVEFDRRGANDAVFYDCDNPDFTKFVTGFGFEENYGSFSDISVIAPELKVAAVNLSSGFYNEHTQHEHINMKNIKDNIKKASKMIEAKTGKFDYIERDFTTEFIWHGKRFGAAEVIDLMPLDDTCHVKNSKGEFEECFDEEYLINSSGVVYRYFFDLDVAIEMPEYSALTQNGTHPRFDDEKAVFVEVVDEEKYHDCCWEAYGAYGAIA